MIDKNYFLTRLRNGEDIDTIGQSVADMMNAAVTEYEEAQEAAQKDQDRREIVTEMIDLIRELAELEGMDPEDFTVTDEEIDDLVDSFVAMFATVSALKKLSNAIDTMPTKTCVNKDLKKSKSDDEILHDFLKNIFN